MGTTSVWIKTDQFECQRFQFTLERHQFELEQISLNQNNFSLNQNGISLTENNSVQMRTTSVYLKTIQSKSKRFSQTPNKSVRLRTIQFALRNQFTLEQFSENQNESVRLRTILFHLMPTGHLPDTPPHGDGYPGRWPALSPQSAVRQLRMRPKALVGVACLQDTKAALKMALQAHESGGADL